MLQDLKRKLVRKASRALVGGFRPSESLYASWFGKVLVARPEEAWPVSNGRPMAPLCQFNLSELPFRPENLADIAFLTVFCDAEELPFDAPNSKGWQLRAYSSMDALIPLPKPKFAEWPIKPFPIHWELLEEDYPCWDDVTIDLPPEVDEKNFDLFEKQSGTKIGGWPTLVQSEIYWAPYNQHPANPEYVFQIDSEPKAQWVWGDLGVGYFGRGTGSHTDEWTFEWQCT